MAADAKEPMKVMLGRKDVDFPLGLGESLVDVEITLEWAHGTTSEPARQGSQGSTEGMSNVVANLGTSS
jgi:hypothetical protein